MSLSAFARIFSRHGLVELAKTLIKVAAIGLVAWLTLRGEFEPAAVLYERELQQPQAAARLYERAGKPQNAAALWEKLGEWRRARDLYQSVGFRLLKEFPRYRKSPGLG